MRVHVRDLKDNGKAWIVVYDRRVPKGYLRKYVGSDWKAAKRAASIIRERLAANDLTFLHGGSSFAPSLQEAGGGDPPRGVGFPTKHPLPQLKHERAPPENALPPLRALDLTSRL